jgi:enamine deaminase RidA (YjgF/YER057c/UK114 family)
MKRIFTGAPSEDAAGYAKAVIAGSTIYVSGTTGRDPDTNAFPDDVSQQTRNALSSIEEALQAAGASLSDAVASRVYITNRDDATAVSRVLGEIFKDIRPTSTFLICQIPAPGAKVEIEITASLAGKAGQHVSLDQIGSDVMPEDNRNV